LSIESADRIFTHMITPGFEVSLTYSLPVDRVLTVSLTMRY